MSQSCPKCQTDNPSDSKFCKECATPLPAASGHPSFTKTLETPVSELTRGTLFVSRYEIIEELGSGGMGKVYRVEDKKANEEIALKLIRPEVSADNKTIDRFRNELTTARKIRHKNVCGMYDLGEHEGIHYITMEYVSGEDLKSLVRRVTFDTGTAIKIAKQVCEGLAEAHRLGVIHRDLKPSNIMIDKEGNARIMDFGIARSLSAKGLTGEGIIIGTPEYMSPEQAEAKEVDHRSDIYSLGVILYEIVTGQQPFTGDTPLAIAMKHKGETPRDPKEINPQIGEDLDRIILRCLEKEKDIRYQSAGELRSELESIEQQLPTIERAVTKKTSITSKEITVSFNVRKVFIPVVLIIAVALAAVLVWQPWANKTAAPSLSDKPSLAVLYFKNSTGDESLDHWRTALSDSIITDLSQSIYFEVLSSDRLFSILRKLDLLEAANYATEDLREVAAEGAVNYVLLGSLFRSGDTFRIDYLIQEIATGKNKGTSRVEGQGEESLFSLVDEITKKIKLEFNISMEQIADDIDRDIGTITTLSPEAYKYYSQGRQAYNVGEYEKSIALMERAVAADPEFAMAYRSMSVAYFLLAYEAKRYETMRKAFELSHRLPDREKYTIEGDFFSLSESTYDKALESYNKVLELYPNDLISNQNSALIYADLEQWDKAIERAEVSRRQKVVQPYTLLVGLYSRKGQYDEARDVVLDYIENIQDSAYVRRRLAWINVCQRKFDQALDEIDKAIAMDPENAAYAQTRGQISLFAGELEAARIEFARLVERENPAQKVTGIRGLSLIASLQGRFSEAAKLAEQGINTSKSAEQKGSEIGFRERLAEIDLYIGKSDEALFQIEEAWPFTMERGDLDQKIRVLVDRGLFYLETRSLQDALKTAGELKGLIESGLNEKSMRYYDYLMGLIEHEKKNYSGAVDYLQRAQSLLPAEWNSRDVQAKFYFALGQAQHRAGNLVEAQKAYEDILPMTFGRDYCQHLYVLAFYELGRVFQDQGNTAQAIEHYQKFLDLWKDADPGLPEVDDARARLSQIKGSN